MLKMPKSGKAVCNAWVIAGKTSARAAAIVSALKKQVHNLGSGVGERVIARDVIGQVG